ncbi:MAG TPA: tetratricopeptide repeat protein [Pyrinomonadaceae bacterium]
MSSPTLHRRSPYQGLIPYGEDDAPFFFGREKEARLIIANLFASPLTVLYGVSGVGKSSVLRAGAANQLRQRDDLLVVVFNAWQGNPLQDLKAAIVKAAARVGAKDIPITGKADLAEFIADCSARLNRRLMIILDQFEEYFLYHPQDDAFTEEFPKALLQAKTPLSFLISIREDALAKLDRFEGRIPNLFDNYLRIEHLSREAAQDAIEKPIEQYNRLEAQASAHAAIEPALVRAVLKQVQTGQVTLGEAGRGTIKADSTEAQIETPYLQLVMTRLWNEETRAGSNILRLKTLNDLGGAERIVRTHLDEAMSTLSPENQEIAAEVFHYLVTPSGTKIAHTIPDLAEYAEIPRARLTPVMEELAGGDIRILRGVAPPLDQPDEPRYEIFHDVLASAILDWRARYVQAQQVIETERQLALVRQRANRLRLGMAGLGLLLLFMTGVTIYAVHQRKVANKAQADADEQKKVAYEQRNKAEEAKVIAEQQTRLAESSKAALENEKKNVEEQRERFKEQAEIARRNAEEALAQTRRANEQARLAREAKDDALRAGAIDERTRLALSATRAGKLDEAIALFTEVRNLYKQKNEPTGEVEALVNISESYATKAGIPSIDYFNLESSGGDPNGPENQAQAVLLYIRSMYAALATEKREQGGDDLSAEITKSQQQAIDNYKEAIRVNKSSKPDGRLLREALMYQRVGDVYLMLDDKQSLVENYGKAADDYQQVGAYNDEAMLLDRIGDYLLTYTPPKPETETPKDGAQQSPANEEQEKRVKLEILKQAADYFEEAKMAYQEADNTPRIASTLFKLGKLYDDQSKDKAEDKQQAADYYTQAAAFFIRANDLGKAASTYAAAGAVYSRADDTANALDSYKKALAAYEQLAESDKAKATDNYVYQNGEKESIKTIANLYIEANQKQKAEEYFDSVVKGLKSAPGRARFLNNVADFYASSEERQTAVKYYQRELQIWRETGNRPAEIATSSDLGKVYLSLDDKAAAIKSVDAALATYRQIDPTVKDENGKPAKAGLVNGFLSSLADILVKAGEKRKALEIYREMYQFFRSDKEHALANYYSLLNWLKSASKLYTELGERPQAEELLKDVAAYYKELGNRQAEGNILNLVGDFYKESGDKRKAIDYYEQARVAFETVKTDSGRYGVKYNLTRTIAKLYLELDGKPQVEAYFSNIVNSYRQPDQIKALADALFNFGDFYREAGDKLKAIEYYGQARTAYQKTNNRYDELSLLDQMKRLYEELGNREEAQRLSREANQLRRLNRP